MAQGSTVLRNIFGFFNLLFAIVGVLVIALAIVSHLQIVQELGHVTAVIILYVFGFVILAISFLGAYGAFRQVRWMLVVFVVLMCVGFVLMVRFAVVMAFQQPQITQAIEETINKMKPLDQSPEDFKEFLDKLQKSMQCCGTSNGYNDWNDHVPESCDCSPTEKAETNTCVALPGYGSEALFSVPEESSRFVYKQACGPLFLGMVKKFSSIIAGILFGLLALTVLGIALSSCLIHQINKSRNAVVLPPAFVLSTEPPKYDMLIREPYH